MNYFLAKTDPSTYSIEDFAKDKITVWDGVRNGQAVQALKAMQKGDKVLIYHSQGEGSIRGLATVTKNIGPDPKDNRSWLVEFKLSKSFKEPFVTLKQVKESGKFNDLALVKNSRLSTMSVSDKFISWLNAQGLSI
jgi:predicted RNA-binding protein with PUA-like domain